MPLLCTVGDSVVYEADVPLELRSSLVESFVKSYPGEIYYREGKHSSGKHPKGNSIEMSIRGKCFTVYPAPAKFEMKPYGTIVGAGIEYDESLPDKFKCDTLKMIITTWMKGGDEVTYSEGSHLEKLSEQGIDTRMFAQCVNVGGSDLTLLRSTL